MYESVKCVNTEVLFYVQTLKLIANVNIVRPPASSRDQSFLNFRFGVIGRLVPFNKGGVFLGSLRFYDFLVYAFSFMEFFMVVELNVRRC